MGGIGSGAKKREYPKEVIDQVIAWYASGLTVAEIRAVAPPGYRVQTILERYLPERRKAVKRNQFGERNDSWRGNSAGYQALHLRVESARGKPSRCEWCEVTEGRFEWANLTGNYTDVYDFVRLCVSCHRKYDFKRRKETGRNTSITRKGRGKNV